MVMRHSVDILAVGHVHVLVVITTVAGMLAD